MVEPYKDLKICLYGGAPFRPKSMCVLWSTKQTYREAMLYNLVACHKKTTHLDPGPWMIECICYIGLGKDLVFTSRE